MGSYSFIGGIYFQVEEVALTSSGSWSRRLARLIGEHVGKKFENLRGLLELNLKAERGGTGLVYSSRPRFCPCSPPIFLPVVYIHHLRRYKVAIRVALCHLTYNKENNQCGQKTSIGSHKNKGLNAPHQWCIVYICM